MHLFIGFLFHSALPLIPNNMMQTVNLMGFGKFIYSETGACGKEMNCNNELSHDNKIYSYELRTANEAQMNGDCMNGLTL